jgi:cytochrome c biogenesis protein CcmG, thiol:disulfide interchange protein DsbE
MRSRRRGLLGVLCLSLLGVLAGTAVYAQGEASSAAAEFREKDIATGAAVFLDRYRGEVVMLNFWGPWCLPCRVEVPDLEALQAAHKGQLVVIGAAVFSSEVSVEKFYVDNRINYPVIMGSYELMGDYGGIKAVPTTIIIDRKGRIAARVVGSRTREQYEEMVGPLLAKGR